MSSTPEFEREVRFAVVIYGGVSLAIYINGIVQEMLRMVRSTALPESQLTSSEKVYRKLACQVGAPEDATDPRTETGRVALRRSARAAEPRTKFVVDILSGTSAGGINAVYLAKALANGQSLDQLADMWINVADIDRLLNDRQSAEAPVQAEVPPKSLLNSRWMYLKLLQALDGMDAGGTGAPLVDDLDLFSTTTDLDGLPLPIALADRQVMELRHRNVYHFRRRGDAGETDRNDFTKDKNPFLAYAARCTSAFPFAFEPMALCDIFDIVRAQPAHQDQPYCEPDTKHWQEFYLDYVRAAGPDVTPFRLRSFGDGGYLDNKPFSYAIDTVMRRRAVVPVDRKLIYIEPSPEKVAGMFRLRKDSQDRPDAIQNSLAALVDLPRYETIRQDLDRVIAWNRNVARLKRIIRGLSQEQRGAVPEADSLQYRAWKRLRLSYTTDQMANRVSEALEIDPDSARGAAVRVLAGAWRVETILTDEGKQAFLDAYDADYCARAIQYVRNHLRQAYKDPHAEMPRDRYQALSGIGKMLHAKMEAPLPDLTSQIGDQPGIDLTPEQRDADLDFVMDPATAAKRQVDPPLPAMALDATDAARELRVKWLFEHTRWLDYIGIAHRRLSQHFGPALKTMREGLTPLLEPFGGWEHFELHDSLVFPVIFSTNLGEFEEIAIVRISPDDATPIEGVDDGSAPSGPKLKGQLFGAFGGFLDRGWRLHDMLLGRLDAAERLIAAVLPSSEPEVKGVREELIKEAQEEIAREWGAKFGGAEGAAAGEQ